MGKYIFIFTAAATAFIFYSFTVFNQPGNEEIGRASCRERV